MSEKDFISLIEEILELDSGDLTGEELLEDIVQWDSLAVVSLIALTDERYGVTLSPKKLSESKKVKDLVALLNNVTSR